MIATMPLLYDKAIVIAETEGMDRETWLKARKGGIGASDAAAVMGQSRYSSPVVVYYEKTEELPPREFSRISEKKMAAGNRMESVIAEWFAEETGKRVVRQPFIIAHSSMPWIRGNIDFGIVGEESGLECKNTDNPRDWKDNEIPDEYWIQCQQYMAITGMKRWYIAFCLSGWDFDYRVVERSDVYIDQLYTRLTDFWHNNVLAKVPPAFDGSDASAELLDRLYPAETLGAYVDLPDDIDDLMDQQEVLKAQKKEIDEEITAITNIIKDKIGEHEFGISKRHRIRYSTVNVGEKVVKAYSYRRLWPKKLT